MDKENNIRFFPLKLFAVIFLILISNVNAKDQSNLNYTLLEKPALPLLGILRVSKSKSYPMINPYPESEEIAVILKMYKGLHITGVTEIIESSHLWKKFRDNDPNFMILPYFQSTLATETGLSGKLAEEDPLNFISMYLVGTIETAIIPERDKFKIIPDSEEIGLGLKASTTSEDYSKSINEYISVLRIGNEIMKIIKVNKNSHEVNVLRGYKNTKAETHQSGSKVFAPVYRGKKGKVEDAYGASSKYPDYTDTGVGGIPQYHLRIDSEKTIEILAEKGAGYIQKGASGLWLDLTSPVIFVPCNAYGEKVVPWNFKKNEKYNNIEYLTHQELKCKKLRDEIKRKTKIIPQIVANNLANGKYFEKGGNGMNLVRATEQKLVPINGVILEAAFCFYQTKEWFEINKWKINLSTLIHGSQNKYPVWPWLKNVKYEYLPMSKNEESDRYQLFDYASTLLGYEKDARIVCPLPLHRIDNKGIRTLNLPEYLFFDIGKPIERVKYDDIDKMLIPNRHTYMRKWSKAIVLVNPTDSNDTNISIPAGYLDPQVNKEVRKIGMQSHTGKILLKMD